MNRIFLSASLALALSSSLVIAQQSAAPAPAPAVKQHHTHNPQREAARISKRLNLSSDQTARLEPIFADRDNKIAALTNDTTISPVVMKQQMKAIHQQTRQQLAAILTPEQLQQIKSHRHGQGAPPQTQPQTQSQPNPQSAF